MEQTGECVRDYRGLVGGERECGEEVGEGGTERIKRERDAVLQRGGDAGGA